MSDTVRTAKEIETELAGVLAEDESFYAKTKTPEVSEEDAKRYDEVLANVEMLQGDFAKAKQSERLYEAKAKVSEVATRPAPRIITSKTKAVQQGDQIRSLATWMQGNNAKPEDRYHAE